MLEVSPGTQMSQALDEVWFRRAGQVVNRNEFKNALADFFRTLPDGVVLKMMKSKRPHESWRDAIARELDMIP